MVCIDHSLQGVAYTDLTMQMARKTPMATRCLPRRLWIYWTRQCHLLTCSPLTEQRCAACLSIPHMCHSKFDSNRQLCLMRRIHTVLCIWRPAKAFLVSVDLCTLLFCCCAREDCIRYSSKKFYREFKCLCRSSKCSAPLPIPQ